MTLTLWPKHKKFNRRMMPFTRRFGQAGHFAQCAIHHMWLLLHKVSDDEGEDAFDIYVLRSFAASFWHWMTSTAVLIGNEVKR